MGGYNSSAKRRRTDKLRELGRPVTVRDADQERAENRVRSWKARGMSLTQMARQTGLPLATVSNIHSRSATYRFRTSYAAIAMMRFEEPDDNALVDPTGTIRRLQALRADGFTLQWVEENGGGSPSQSRKLATGRYTRTRGLMARRVREVYDLADGRTAEDFGILPGRAASCRTYGRKFGWSPRHTWDPDTIDDPEAFPEWTGACGTVQGWLIHKREDIPMCDQCRGRAHDLRGPGREYADFDGSKLRKLRYRRGIELGELAKRIGVHKSTIMYWEQGRMKPHPNSPKLELVLRELDASPADVMEDP